MLLFKPNLVWGHSGAGFSCNDKLCQGNMQNGILLAFTKVGSYILANLVKLPMPMVHQSRESFRRRENFGWFYAGKI